MSVRSLRCRVFVAIVDVAIHSHVNRWTDQIPIVLPCNECAFAWQPSLCTLQQLPSLNMIQTRWIREFWISLFSIRLTVMLTRRCFVSHGTANRARILLFRMRYKLWTIVVGCCHSFVGIEWLLQLLLWR